MPSQAQILAWAQKQIYPILDAAEKFMPMAAFAGLLIGMAIPMARDHGMSESDLRELIETSIKQHFVPTDPAPPSS